MKKNSILVVSVLIIALIAYFLLRPEKVIQNVKIYETGTTIGSLFEENLSFEEVDRTEPMGTLFSKTRVTDPAQIHEIYVSEVLKDDFMMEMIYKRWTNTTALVRFSNKEPLFSFYYEGLYGPPMWFCFFETQLNEEKRVRIPFSLELEDGAWRQVTNVAKYPVMIALDDLDTDYYIFDAKNPLTPEIIRDFIARCQEIDEIITERMQTDPDYYSPVQDGPY